MMILKVILCIILPPAAAYRQVNLSIHFWVNILLTILGGVPGMVHAIWLVFTDRKA